MIRKIEIPHFRKLLIMFTLIVIVAAMVVPSQDVFAVTGVSSASDTIINTSSLQHDFFALKGMFRRNENAVPKLRKNLNKIEGMVAQLREKNNKRWAEMQVLYYDYNSSFQAAISHAYEARVIIYQHAGFNDKGKVENEYMAKWTVTRFRGAVLGLVARIRECNKIVGQATRLMRLAKN